MLALVLVLALLALCGVQAARVASRQVYRVEGPPPLIYPRQDQ